MPVDTAIYPSLRELEKGSDRGFSLSSEMLADLDTPVSAYLKLRGDGRSPSFLLESAEGGERIARYSFVGSEPRQVLRIKDGVGRLDPGQGDFPVVDPLDHVRELVEAYGDPTPPRNPFEGGAIGYISYEAASYFERLPVPSADPLNLPDVAFMQADTVLVFDHIARRARIVSHARPEESVSEGYERAACRIEIIKRQLAAPLPPPAPAAGESQVAGGQPLHSSVEPLAYEAIVRRAKEYILAGDILQVVLAQELSFPLAGDPFDLYRQLRASSPSPYMYYLDFVDHQVIGASPELLVQVKDGRVSTRPIAGTRPRGVSIEQDERLERELLADEKERAEHLMLVDLARNDVGRVSSPGSVQVSNFMSVERFSHVMHIVSDVAGKLRSDQTSYDALRAAFPAGTVSGAPKIRAMEIIAELEDRRRGPYAGAVGFINTAGDLEMAITIRTGVTKDGAVHLGVGAGIVSDSDPSREYLETMSKARALLEAAGIEA